MAGEAGQRQEKTELAVVIFWWTKLFQSMETLHSLLHGQLQLNIDRQNEREARDIYKKALIQRSQTQFLEGHSSAEFSSSQLQITPAWKFLVILNTLISWIRCVWLGLELNCAELWPSRNWVWDQCSNQFLTWCYYVVIGHDTLSRLTWQ